MTKAQLHAALAEAEDKGRIAGEYSYAPGDSRGTRYVVWGHGVKRTYNRREVEAFLSSGKSLYAHEYPEAETRFSIGYDDEHRAYFVELYGDDGKRGRVSPFYRSRDRAARAAVEKEAEYSAT